ncbi:IS200/IS605 family transposase [Natranaerobius thermophilus]|uniref:Transposase IS200-family protein n=1 Tax=Natranaerobius thermophilus (strain ATCC BAA-1301 / DSM 18059 / JW/NM-WN-LF) TaxID=457570 RepID=B2A1B2_NATTJ|nr:IS200/IS605 family transposase [Natranaerobius thermophilus]ACB86050.1 transposase IS200-family protein [Natranaerobius thermophilus JW/NM-WN-LF]
MSKNRWTTTKTTVYNLGYHIIFCPKYRREVLTGKIEQRLKQLFLEKANELEIEIQDLTIMPDHVHLFIKADPTLAPHYIVRQLKGYSAKILRKEFPELKSRLPSLWTRSYYVESVGHISEDTIRKYIEDQEGK